MVISPDGTRLAYITREGGASVDQLYVRELDKVAAVQLDGGAGLGAPFFSRGQSMDRFFRRRKIEENLGAWRRARCVVRCRR